MYPVTSRVSSNSADDVERRPRYALRSQDCKRNQEDGRLLSRLLREGKCIIGKMLNSWEAWCWRTGVAAWISAIEHIHCNNDNNHNESSFLKPRLIPVAILLGSRDLVSEGFFRECVALRRDAEVPKCGQVLTRWTTISNAGHVACASWMGMIRRLQNIVSARWVTITRRRGSCSEKQYHALACRVQLEHMGDML